MIELTPTAGQWAKKASTWVSSAAVLLGTLSKLFDLETKFGITEADVANLVLTLTALIPFVVAVKQNNVSRT